ncbi:hypothetical protein Droror1_Dr00005667 [Drosera rotundifolia]
MSSMVNNNKIGSDDDLLHHDDDGVDTAVSSRLYLKSEEVELDKDAVLGRIRHCKRVNRIKNTVHALFDSLSLNSSKKTEKGMNSAQPNSRTTSSWIDDAFAAP